MTNITGKIYQMKNAAGTENRFPRTVIEAVLGLSSYLQNQFSSLANLYMPIEGIHESKTGQEFVYRATPNTIKANQLEVSKIKGKTLAWNQLNANPAPATPFNISPGGSFSCSVNLGGSAFSIPAGHTVLLKARIKLSVGEDAKWKIYANGGTSVGGTSSTIVSSPVTNVQDVVTLLIAPTTAITSGLLINSAAIANDETVTVLGYNVFDLTIAGIADEISTPADFKALYPDIYGYNPGTLISNDAEAVETTGVNQWDEEFINGYYDTHNGQFIASNAWKANKNPIFIVPNATYYNKKDGSTFVVLCYDKSGNYLGFTQPGGGAEFTPISGARYMNFYCQSDTTYVCINLSNPAINGQYFPYWKRDLQLNITTRKDTDGNVPFADGMKGAGTAADWADKVGGEKRMKRVDLGSLNWSMNVTGQFYAELPTPAVAVVGETNTNVVCSKYVAGNAYSVDIDKVIGTRGASPTRVWVVDKNYNDAAAFTAAMDGVYLDYELATPVPFTWAEPLVTSMRAGTTEARISPNEDGLSAPFCGDLYYSVVLDSSVEDASYAYSAGKLLNSHKIWGQDFNGTQDVSGNLTSNGVITGTQLVSTITNAAPLTVASSVLVNNLNVEKVGGKTLTEILASNVASATRLQDNTSHTAWGRTFWSNGVPQNISGALENVTTINASGLATLSGGIALGTSTNAQAAKMVWSEADNAWHLQGNLYVDGYITAGAANQ